MWLCFLWPPWILCQKMSQKDFNHVFVLCCCCVCTGWFPVTTLLFACCFTTQQDKGDVASGGAPCPASPPPLNHPSPPSRPTHRWHVIARHWLRQTRRRTSGVLPVTTRASRNIWVAAHWIKHTQSLTQTTHTWEKLSEQWTGTSGSGDVIIQD